MREWYKKNKNSVFDRIRINEYGLSPEQYLQLLAEQGNKCPVCGTDLTGHRKYAVDHCHKTGRVRGILCPKCNTGLGHFKDDPELLNKAADYLRRHIKE